MVMVGLVSRIAPLLNLGGRLLRQFPTEDGYLMLTIARNIALGRGISVSDGTIPTNGTQPLTALLWAACFRLVGGDKVAGVALVQWVSVLVAILAVWWLYHLGRTVLGDQPWGRPVAALAASIWFASHLNVGHSMNCLETGVYTLVMVGCVWLFARWTGSGQEDWPMNRCVLFGLALGIAFWARNDAVFLVAAACLTRVCSGLEGRLSLLRRRVLETFVFGGVSVLVATPWLVNNLVRFGHIVPISGIAESADTTFAQNLYLVPSKLAEYLSVIVGIPSVLESRQPVFLFCSLVVLAALALWVLTWRFASQPARSVILLVALNTVFLSAYYGLLFGAPHFMSRYLMPVSPFLAIWTVSLLAIAWAWTRQRSWPNLAVPAAVIALAIVVLFNARVYYGMGVGTSNMHFQVKEWIDDNVPDETWVGAIQTGTIGFFHDRTFNLDGKVSPPALQARLERRTLEYVVASPIQYLADWTGIASWITLHPISDHFELIVDDQQRNLAVLRRKAVAGTRIGQEGHHPEEVGRRGSGFEAFH